MTLRAEPNPRATELVTQLRMRERAGLNQQQAGLKLDGSRYQVNRIENGRVPAHSAMLDVYEASEGERASCLAMWELAWRPGGRRIRGKQLRRAYRLVIPE